MTALIETRGLGRTFGALNAVTDLNLEVPAGELRAVIGPNGAGKTTLFHLISGLLPATSGRVLFRGEDVTRLHSDADVGHRAQRAEGTPEAARLEEGGHARPRTSPINPRGRKITMRTNTTPVKIIQCSV